MKTIKLMNLSIMDFKGIHTLDIPFGGSNAMISGQNGEGKTSVYDALCWLLTGKDARGNQPESENFNIKPRDAHERVLSGAMPTVTGTFDVDGDTITFRKVYKEKWEKPRGMAEAKFAGHTTEHYIDDIPQKESEYKRIVGEIIPENVFQLLADVYRFPASLKWQDRRKLLFELCSVQDDKAIMAKDARFAPLSEALGRWSVDEYKQSLKTSRRKVNDALEKLPVRIDEVEKSVSALRGMDFAALHTQADQLTARKSTLEAELYDITHDTALMGAKNAFATLQNQLTALENENTAHRHSQQVPAIDPRKEIQRELDTARRELEREQSAFSAAKTQIQMAEMRLEDYRAQWKTVHSKKYDGKDTCPTCGQKLPPDKIQAAKAEFERDKKARQDRLLADSDVIKSGIADQQKLADAAEAKAAQWEQKIQQLEKNLAEAAVPEAPAIEDLPDYARQREELQTSIRQADEKCRELAENSNAQAQKIKADIVSLETQLSSLRAEIAKESNIAAAENRIKELQAERHTQVVEMDKLDALLALCEDFTRYKVQSITDAINSHFKRVRFRLFREQINGGLDDCCDVMMDGKPYGSLSDGEKVKAGMDIISTLSRFYGVKMPLFIDRAESVTDMPQADMQMIQLVVRENRKLEVEVK